MVAPGVEVVTERLDDGSYAITIHNTANGVLDGHSFSAATELGARFYEKVALELAREAADDSMRLRTR